LLAVSMNGEWSFLLYSKILSSVMMCVLCTAVSEPSVYNSRENLIQLSAEQIAKDYVTFHGVLKSYPCFIKSRVFGPAIFPFTYIPEGQEMIQA